MLSLFKETLLDTVKMLPLLFFIYMAIELLEYMYDRDLRELVSRSARKGPFIGALAGAVPQCGFSVISTSLYTQRYITLGTLLAVYLSTSDEAIPIILANPQKFWFVTPVILLKILIAVTAGYAIDLFSRSKLRKPEKKVSPKEDTGCCGHHCTNTKIDLRELIAHPLEHTLKIFGYIFIITLLLNIVVFKIGQNNLGAFLLGKSFWQPVLTALIGLIPNCAASVIITQVFLKGGIGFGSLMSGLCTSSGLGLLVLFKENRSWKDTLKVLGLLYFISVAVGLGLQYFSDFFNWPEFILKSLH